MLWVDIVQMVFGADSIAIVQIYVNFCENNEEWIIALHVHAVNAYSLIDISIDSSHFAVIHVYRASSVSMLNVAFFNDYY